MARLVGVGSRIPKELYDRICEEAKAKKTTRSEIIRRHLTLYYILESENEILKKRIEEYRKMIIAFKEEAKSWRELYEKLKEEIEELRNKVELYKMEIERLKDELNKPIWQKLKFW